MAELTDLSGFPPRNSMMVTATINPINSLKKASTASKKVEESVFTRLFQQSAAGGTSSNTATVTTKKKKRRVVLIKKDHRNLLLKNTGDAPKTSVHNHSSAETVKNSTQKTPLDS